MDAANAEGIPGWYEYSRHKLEEREKEKEKQK